MSALFQPARVAGFFKPFLTLALLGSSTFAAAAPTQPASDRQPEFNYDAYTASVEQTQTRQMRQLIADSGNFSQQVKAACSALPQTGPDAPRQPMAEWPALSGLQQSWLASQHSWQQLQVFPLGPNTDVTARLNISFWPDKKNLVERKARTLLQQGEQAELKRGGIALQGFTASEYLLFDNGHLQRATPADSCHLLSQISQQNAENARGMLTRWLHSEFAGQWHDAALGNEQFSSTTQAAGYLLSGLAETLEAIAKNKLYKPFRLNDAQAPANRYLAENWRSGQSLNNLSINFAQIQAYYRGLPAHESGRTINGPDQLLRHLGFAAEADRIVSALDSSSATLQQLVALGHNAYNTAEGKQLAQQLHQQIKSLEQALRKPLPHFQLTQRFNSADGD